MLTSRLLRQKVLDPTSERKLRDIRAQYQDIDTTLKNVDHQLDSQWEQKQAKKKYAK